MVVARQRSPRGALVPSGDAEHEEVLRVVGSARVRPRGPRFDVRAIERAPARALRGGPRGIAVRCRRVADEVEIVVYASGQSSDEDVAWAISCARALFGVDDDPSELFDLIRQSPLLGRLARRYACRLTRTPTVFEAFARTVIEQLVTLAEARAATARLFAFAGEELPGTALRSTPTSRAVLDVAPWRLRSMGIGSRRAATLREGARRAAALERLREVGEEEAISRMQSLPGVGPWTANLTALRGLAYADAVPVGDLHAPRLVTEALLGEAGDDDAMLEALAPYRPHRARVVSLIVQAAAAAPGGARRPKIDPHRQRPWAT